MQLQKLTGLEHQKIVDEYSQLLDEISDLSDILNTPDRVKKIISDELNQTKKDHGQERRTLITEGSTETSEEDFITPEDLVVTMSHTGYVKAQPSNRIQGTKKRWTWKTSYINKTRRFCGISFYCKYARFHPLF